MDFESASSEKEVIDGKVVSVKKMNWHVWKWMRMIKMRMTKWTIPNTGWRIDERLIVRSYFRSGQLGCPALRWYWFGPLRINHSNRILRNPLGGPCESQRVAGFTLRILSSSMRRAAQVARISSQQIGTASPQTGYGVSSSFMMSRPTVDRFGYYC